MTEPTARIRLRRLAASLAFCALTFGVLACASAVLKPGRSLVRGAAGAAWSGYLAQPANSVDVVFFGTSHTFDGIDPSEIWRTTGVTGYVLGGPVQTPQVTQYYVRESIRTQRPRVVALEVSTAEYGRSNYSHRYQLVNVGYMPWGANKLGAAFFATGDDDRLATLLDLWTYHGRWTELTRGDFDLLAKNSGDAFMKGFLPQYRSGSVTATPIVVRASDPAADRNIDANMPAFLDIAEYCDAHGIQVLLFLTPTGPPNTYTYHLRRVERALSARHDNVRALDLSAPGAVPGLSYKRDFISSGHLSLAGATKTSRALGRFLAATYGLKDHRGDPVYADWSRDSAREAEYVAAGLAGRR